jgi:uncharacterized protein involved in exopolysaccharide biosynthesis
MSGRQTAAAPLERIAPPDRDSWENPESQPAAANTNDQPFPRRPFSPSQIAAILWANLKKIAMLALALFALGALVLLIFPAKYTATSLVIVDPREQKITNDQDVLPGIGQDAAALQSIVEIAKSDGFLRPLIEKLNVANDAEISGGETNIAQLLTRFRNRLDVSRRGLTYVIAISFSSVDANRAAYYANAVAEAFVAEQARSRATATDEAAGWLNNRLKDLRDKLTASENAIAAFKSKYKIIEAGKDSTTRQVRATELSQQASIAKLRAEEARNRYDQVQRDLRSNVETSASSRSEQLTVLRAQRTQLNDQIAQKRAVFGDRHPDVVISLTQRDELERQIENERRRIIQAARSDFEAQRDQQKHVEALLNEAEREMLTTSEAAVKLQDLQRQADADRSIYEQFLGRYKATNEQRSLQTAQTKIVSFATVPARPSRPSLPLLLVATAMAALLVSASAVTIAEANGLRLPIPAVKTVPATTPIIPSPALAPVAAPDDSVIKAVLDLPVWGVMPFASLPAAGVAKPPPDIKRRLADFLEKIALTRGMRGRVVLLLSGSALHGRSIIAEALSALALDRGMLSVLIQVEPQKFGTAAGLARNQLRANTTVRTTSPSLQLLLTGQGAPHPGDFRSEFDIIVIDGTALQDPAEIAGLVSHIDFAAFLVDEKQDGDRMMKAMDVLSSNRHIAKGVIVDQALAGS